MRPGSIRSPSLTWAAGSGPWRRRISGSALVPVAGKWKTTITAAERSSGSEPARSVSASTPPAEAPTTTMPWSGMDGLLNTGWMAAMGPATEDRSHRPGRPGAVVMMPALGSAVHDKVTRRVDRQRASRTHFLAISLYALPTGQRQLVGWLIGHDDRRDEQLRLRQIEGTQVGHQAASLLLGRL